MRRLLAGLLLAVSAVVALSGCSPAREPAEVAIPAALTSSTLGIDAAEASTSVDGFALELAVFATFDRDTISADDLSELLQIVYDNYGAKEPNRLEVGAIDGTVDDFTLIDLRQAADALGITPSKADEYSITIRWEELLAFLDK